MKEKGEKRHEDKDVSDQKINPLLMINPSVTGTPLGMLPILPIPSLDPEDYEKNIDENDD